MNIEVRNAAGKTVAFLSPKDGMKDVWVDQKLNNECTLAFSLPLTCPKWKELTSECRLIAGGKEFVILRPDVIDFTRDEQGRLWGNAVAVESWYLLAKDYPTVSNHPDEEPVDLEVTILSGGAPTGGYPAGSAGSALAYLLAGSGWALGVCDVDGVHDLETEKLSLLANIEQVQKTWGGFLVWDSLNKTVSLRAEEKWQNYTGFQVRYKKNEKTMTRTENNDITTRLYPFGEDDLDIASVNNGKKYIENFSYTNTVYTDIFVDQDIDDPQELLEKATQELAKICRPRYTYHISMVDLRTLPGYEHEIFDIGDLVDIIDEELGADNRARIVGYKYNVFQPWQCELEIGEPEDRLEARLANTINVADFVERALKPNPTMSNILKGFINTFATTINSASGKLVWSDDVLDAIETDASGRETGRRVRLTPGGIGISKDGGQSFVTAMTGDGILANTIICSALYALSSGDGYTQMVGDGLRVYDAQGNLRAHIGTYGDGKYGVKIIGGEVSADTLIAGYSAADLETKNGAQDKVDAVDQALADHDANSSPHNLPSYVKMQGDGFKVFDGSSRLRAHLGQYLTGVFGLTLLNTSGEKVFETDTSGNLQIKGRVAITGGTGVGNLSDAGELATKDSVDYSDISGSKPPVDADSTKTVIDGGLVTTGTLFLQDANDNIKAGITAKGAGDTNVRIWAGDSYGNRGSAPFRVLQSGEVRVGGSQLYPNVRIYPDGTFKAGMGGGSSHYFEVPWNADGVYNQFRPEETSYKAARWKRDDYNYIYQDPKTIFIKMEGITRLRLSEVDSPHLNLYLGKYTTTESKGCVLKALCGTTPTLQIRGADGSGYIPIAASDFVTASKREYKEDIKLAESALKQVLETPVYNFAMKDEGRPRIGLVYEEAPETLRSMDGLSISDMVGMLWKAVQELNNKVKELL